MIEPALAGILGLLIGSFLNVCIFRLPRDLSVIRPRSFCPECEGPVAAHDNIPVVSYLLLGGKCRRCGASIAVRYPLVELLTSLAFFIGVWKLGVTLAALKFCIYTASLIALLFTDLESRILPDEFTKTGVVMGVLFAAVVPLNAILPSLLMPSGTPRWQLSVMESLMGALIPSLLLWSFGILYEKIRKREGLGLGDVKMIAMIGAFTGLGGAVTTLMFGSLLGSIGGLLYIWLGSKDAATYELPLGTFLAGMALLFAVTALPW